VRVIIVDSARQTLDYLQGVNKKLVYGMVRWIKALGVEPRLCSFSSDVEKTTTVEVEFLLKQGYDVRRLASTDFKDFRIFYFIDDDRDLIKVCEIVRRMSDKETYDCNELPHIQRIKQEYDAHFGRPKKEETC
jgi:mRNA-degrading endonuclease RelE of RelBE toxin-antitoxin system